VFYESGNIGRPYKVMKTLLATSFFTLLPFIFAFTANAQIDEICGYSGSTPWLNTSFVYGRVNLNGFDMNRLPKITVVLFDRAQNTQRYTIDRNGYYCFRDINANGGFIVIEIEGLEVARRSLPQSGLGQHKQDFDITPPHPQRYGPPSTVSVKFAYNRNEKNADLLKKAADAEGGKDYGKAVKLLKELDRNDDADFIAWATLCAVYFGQNNYVDAETSCRKSFTVKPDYTPAMVNLGRVYLIQKQFAAAISTLEKAAEIDPKYARAFQLLGEAYIVNREGTLGLNALNKALELDPIGMAESHLLIALLYDRAGGKSLAAREYKMFLEKIPNHPDRKKFEKYIKDNPEQ